MLTVVTGPPCSGKNTYVQQHAQPGDIIVDFDAIAQALGSPVTHGHPDHIGRVATTVRKVAISSAMKWHHAGHHVWIIQCEPGYGYPGAELVELTAPADELYRRAEAAGRPPYWPQVIDRYLIDANENSRQW